jgi:hypothetical protein
MSKIIHQIAITNNSLSKYIPPNKDSIEKHFSNYDYIFWDIKKVKSFMIKSNDFNVLNAIESVNPYSFKADIAKYYIINKLGGIYVDLNIFFEKSLYVDDSDFLFFKDLQDQTMTSWAVASGLFFSKRNNSILLDAVSQCVNNVNSKYYGGHPLCPTGPNLFGSAIAKNNLPENNNYKIGQFIKKDAESVFTLNNKVVAKYKTNKLNFGNSGLPGGNNYGEMWHNRSVY